MLAAVRIGIIFAFMAAPLLSGADGPGAAALDFLAKARDGKVDLSPGGDTALMEHTTEGKRETIRKALGRLETDLRGGTLELGGVKEDGEFAAVIIHKTGGFDSVRMQVFPIALVKRGKEWRPAPVLASFENAVAGYTVPLKDRLGKLEDWMMRQRVVDLETLVSESAQRTRDLIGRSIVGEDLEGDDLGEITARFLEACAAGNRAAILGFLGGLADPLPADWAGRLHASAAAVGEGSPMKGAWSLLVSPEVVRVRVQEELAKRSGMVSIACLDPAVAGKSGTLGKIRLIHLEFSKDKQGRWMIDLPGVLMRNEDVSAKDDDLDVELLDLFPEKLREAEPVRGAATARDARAATLAGLRSGKLRDLLRGVDFGGRPKDGRIAATAAAEAWWSLNEPGALRVPLELGFREEGGLAVAAYQWFAVNDADRYEPRSLFFRKTDAGWVWSPGIVPGAERDAHAALSGWVKEKQAEWRLSWRETLMEPSVKLEGIAFGKTATDEEVRGLMARWGKALEDRDLAAALSQVAWFGGGDGGIPIKTLRNLSYELADAQQGAGELTAIHRAGPWVAAAMRRASGNGVRNAFMPVVMTPAGARLLPEIDLLADDNRTRNFLNEASFERLGKAVGEEKLAKLRTLFDTFRKELK